jgi:hypothetical protein
LITANRLTDASFTRLLQVSALLFFIGTVIGGLAIRNSVDPAEPVPDEDNAPVVGQLHRTVAPRLVQRSAQLGWRAGNPVQ